MKSTPWKASCTFKRYQLFVKAATSRIRITVIWIKWSFLLLSLLDHASIRFVISMLRVASHWVKVIFLATNFICLPMPRIYWNKFLTRKIYHIACVPSDIRHVMLYTSTGANVIGEMGIFYRNCRCTSSIYFKAMFPDKSNIQRSAKQLERFLIVYYFLTRRSE